MSEFQDALDNVKTLKNQDAHDTFIQKTKTTIKGSAVGVVVGLMYGWYNKKNLYVCAILGAVGGGAVNYFVFQRN
jgi:ABC-type amino acid transport system permease subunit